MVVMYYRLTCIEEQLVMLCWGRATREASQDQVPTRAILAALS